MPLLSDVVIFLSSIVVLTKIAQFLDCVTIAFSERYIYIYNFHNVQFSNQRILYRLMLSPILTLSDRRLFSALKQNIGGHKFKCDGEVETVVTRWMVT
jgi:hypothetical protein